MSIADDLKHAVDTCLGPRSTRNTSVEARRVLHLHARRAADPRQCRQMDDTIADAELGTAAYLLGIHYQIHGRRDQAEHWLHIAAARDVADAAVRLAMLLEYRSVVTDNTSIDTPSTTEGDLTRARRWYQAAAKAGYRTHDAGDPTPLTPLAFDCCPAVAQAAGIETADEIISAARRQAAFLLRQARADVKVIIDAARHEVDDLARQRAEVEKQMRLLQHVVTDIAATETQPRRRWRRLLARGNTPTPRTVEPDAWQQMRDHLRAHDSTPQRRAVRRSMITRIMTLLKLGDAIELDVLDLDIETEDAVPTSRHNWARPDAPIRARAG
ncbi:Sel1 repeat-containing protein [Micromonospora matsumotoense]|uniref:Sel1 repeat-containing protein n=1 Tax=Micromonospora matsumotoense TaxID=121616 RepID=A0A1C5AAG5_9ACTN|nr:hypothetical protein [Micromonospora matsumotoense]SCF42207.1 Sel1 repeat-containing protein [Micromonospora matsumotoense]